MTDKIVDTIKARLGNPNIEDEDLSKILELVEQYASEGKGVQEIINLVSKKMGVKADDDSVNQTLKCNKDSLVREASVLRSKIMVMERGSGNKQELAKLRRDRVIVLKKLRALQ